MKYIFEDYQDDTEMELFANGEEIHCVINGGDSQSIYLDIEEAENFSEALGVIIEKAKTYQEANSKKD